MSEPAFATVNYEVHDRQVCWRGVSLKEGEEFNSFLAHDVAARLYDDEAAAEFEPHLRGLANTGFARDSLNAVLAAEIPEERSWAVGEAMAEAYLKREYEIAWPWNMERDKRNSKASLPGADLVGFKIDRGVVRLALGEVKTSAQAKAPPGVMGGRSGLTYQIDNLANDLSLACQLLKWLHPRCKGTENEILFDKACEMFLNSDNKAIALFGVLIRDTQPSELDLKAGGQTLAKSIRDPTTCHLIGVYLPCRIADLPAWVSGGGS